MSGRFHDHLEQLFIGTSAEVVERVMDGTWSCSTTESIDITRLARP